MAFAAAAATTSCAKLQIEVEVLDRKFWSSPDFVETQFQAQIVDKDRATWDGRYQIQIDRTKVNVHQSVDALTKKTNAEGHPFLATNFVARLSSDLDQELDSAFAVARTKYREAAAAVAKAQLAGSQSEREAAMKSASESYDAAGGAISTALAKISALLRNSIQVAESDSDASKRAAAETKASIAPAITEAAEAAAGATKYAIFEDWRTPYVVLAGSDYWGGPYEGAVARGSFGNSDIAIKMDNQSDFGPFTYTLKGVRLDASKVIQATFAVGRTAVSTVASLYGIPIPKPSAGTGSAGASGGGGSAAVPFSPRTRKLDAETSIRELRSKKLGMVETTLAYQKSLESDDAAIRKAGIQGLKAALATYLDASSKP